MVHVVRLFAILVALFVATLSVYMTFKSGETFIKGSENIVFATLFAAFDVAKFLLPTLAAYLMLKELIREGYLARTIYVFFTALSFLAHVGLVTNLKDDDIGASRAAHESRALAQGRKGRIEAQLSSLGKVRPLAEIEGEIRAVELDAIYDRSKQCGEATLGDSRDLCQRYERLKAEKLKAAEVKALQAQLDDAVTVLEARSGAEVYQQASALTSQLASSLGIAEGSLLVIIAVLLALGIECCSSLLLQLAIASGWNSKPTPETELEPVEVPVIEPEVEKPAEEVDLRSVLDAKTWIDGHLRTRRGSSVPLEIVYNNYTEVATQLGMAAVKLNAFSRALTAMNFPRTRQNKVLVVLNAALEGKPQLSLIERKA